jgi:hypothetical protein
VQVVPDRRQNLQEAYDHGTHAKLKAQREKVPASNIALLEDFLLILEEWLAPPPAAPVPTDAMPVPGDEADSAALGGPAPVTDDPGALLGMGATPAVASPMGLDPALLGAGM